MFGSNRQGRTVCWRGDCDRASPSRLNSLSKSAETSRAEVSFRREVALSAFVREMIDVHHRRRDGTKTFVPNGRGRATVCFRDKGLVQQATGHGE
jgi:hypothetical protein